MRKQHLDLLAIAASLLIGGRLGDGAGDVACRLVNVPAPVRLAKLYSASAGQCRDARCVAFRWSRQASVRMRRRGPERASGESEPNLSKISPG